jgi:arylsulfatase A-like enzyme
VLKKAGYSTGLVGKWGLGERGSSGVPQNHGFDQFIGYLNQVHAHDYYTDHLDRYDSITGFNDRNVFHENQGGRQGLYIPDVLTTAALNFVRLQKPSTVNSHPFFLYLAYTIPHANNEAAKVSGHGMQVPDSGPYRDEDWPRPEKNKAAMISRMDADIGKLLQLLKNRNLEQNTVVVFTSDNGPHKEGGVDPAFFQSSGGLRGIKRDLYEGGVRVPLIVRWSGHIKPGQTVSMPVAFWDILPTACELAGLQVPKGIDGISFAPALLGQTQTNRHAYLYWEFHERGFQQALRMDQWKAVRRQTGEPLELYNLETDRKESINVAGKQPQVLARIEEHLKAARTESPFYPARPAVKDNSGRTP